jgi:hypothetical protein
VKDTHDLIDETLVGVEIEGEAGVAERSLLVPIFQSPENPDGDHGNTVDGHSLLLDEDARSTLGGLGTNAALKSQISVMGQPFIHTTSGPWLECRRRR